MKAYTSQAGYQVHIVRPDSSWVHVVEASRIEYQGVHNVYPVYPYNSVLAAFFTPGRNLVQGMLAVNVPQRRVADASSVGYLYGLLAPSPPVTVATSAAESPGSLYSGVRNDETLHAPAVASLLPEQEKRESIHQSTNLLCLQGGQGVFDLMVVDKYLIEQYDSPAERYGKLFDCKVASIHGLVFNSQSQTITISGQSAIIAYGFVAQYVQD